MRAAGLSRRGRVEAIVGEGERVHPEHVEMSWTWNHQAGEASPAVSRAQDVARAQDSDPPQLEPAPAVQGRLIADEIATGFGRTGRFLACDHASVVPDILANGGGVVLSYFEWVQNRMGFFWIDAVIEKRLTRFMREAWTAVRAVQDEYDVRLRMAANLLAVQRVATADESRGIYA